MNNHGHITTGGADLMNQIAGANHQAPTVGTDLRTPKTGADQKAPTTERSPYLDTAPLSPGDTVRLVAPSGPTDEDSLQRAVSRLESWGLNVVLGEHVRARHPRVSYLAGTDDERRADLVDAWCDPTTSAVIALRGGYGAMRLLDGIDFDQLRRHGLRPDGRPKLLTGSSDITALHQAWDHHLGVATLFCPMPGNDPFASSQVVPAEVASWLFEPWGGRELGFPAGSAEVRTIWSENRRENQTKTSKTWVARGAEGDEAGEFRTQSVDSGLENRHFASGTRGNGAGSAGEPAPADVAEAAAHPDSAHAAHPDSATAAHPDSAHAYHPDSADAAHPGSADAGHPVSRARTVVPGTAVGRLMGGNLSLVAAAIGSPELADVRELRARRGPTIAMLEDVEEDLYRLDNLLIQLVRGGWFTSADAVVLGSWVDCAPSDEVDELFSDHLGGMGIPIISEMGFGHDPDAPSAPLGVDVGVDAQMGKRPRMWVCR